jgi:hypothetical protein
MNVQPKSGNGGETKAGSSSCNINDAAAWRSPVARMSTSRVLSGTGLMIDRVSKS